MSERLREHQADFTPLDVIRQGMLHLSHNGVTAGRILDPSAGAGAFGVVFREVWPRAWTCGVELREEEKKNIQRNYDGHYIGPFDGTLIERSVRAQSRNPHSGLGGPFDLVATNPPFSLLDEFVRGALRLVVPGGRVVMLQRSVWGQAEETSHLFQDHPPSLQLRITGRIKFRTGINPHTKKEWGVDSNDYSWWVWEEGTPASATPIWKVVQLPLLTAEQRSWKIRPGMAA